MIGITGHADVPMAVRAMQAGVVDLIERPLDELRLLESIQGALRHDTQTRCERAWREEVTQRLATLTPREQQVMEVLLAMKCCFPVIWKCGPRFYLPTGGRSDGCRNVPRIQGTPMLWGFGRPVGAVSSV